VQSGEGVAVLGLRKAGRSTLLSVVTGLYRPDRGRVLVHGRATGPVAIGGGFTAAVPLREILAVGAQLMGLTPQQLDERRDDVLAFAGLDRTVLDVPLREISGVQRRRVGYALALAARPDVFVADGLVVMGKGEQAEQCYRELETMRESGHVLLLATNTKAVTRRLCARGIVLHHGELIFDGPLRPALSELQALRRGARGRPPADEEREGG
jgi:ABC-2 type transport system ATP-binding protein